MFCYFLPFVVFVLIFDCSSSHLSLSLRLQRQDGEDLAVKGVEEEVRTAGTAVPLSAIFPQLEPPICDLLASTTEM